MEVIDGGNNQQLRSIYRNTNVRDNRGQVSAINNKSEILQHNLSQFLKLNRILKYYILYY